MHSALLLFLPVLFSFVVYFNSYTKVVAGVGRLEDVRQTVGDEAGKGQVVVG